MLCESFSMCILLFSFWFELLEQSPFHPKHPERQSELYQHLETLRWQDALKYQQEVESLKHEHGRLMRLIVSL